MTLALTYVGCEGVLVRSDAGTVLIDGLYGDEASPFGVPPEPVLERLRDARPPFDHSKLMTVDGAWSLVGSANWDVRSLRLNFEFNVECYGSRATTEVDRVIDAKIAAARKVPPAEFAARPVAVKLRDSAARLLLPYL